MGLDLADFLKKQGWRAKNTRTKFVSHPTKEGVKLPVGTVVCSYVRIHTFGGREWFHAGLNEKNNGWHAIISWRELGKDRQLASTTETSPFTAAQWVEEKLKLYETQARLGWVP